MSDESSAGKKEQMSLPAPQEGDPGDAPTSRPAPRPDARLKGAQHGGTEAFADRYEFQDDVHGPIKLNRVERDLVDTPEFQRLFRLGQLGFVDLVYPTANHSRGVHSIGACHWAKKLTDRLNSNAYNLKAGT